MHRNDARFTVQGIKFQLHASSVVPHRVYNEHYIPVLLLHAYLRMEQCKGNDYSAFQKKNPWPSQWRRILNKTAEYPKVHSLSPILCAQMRLSGTGEQVCTAWSWWMISGGHTVFTRKWWSSCSLKLLAMTMQTTIMTTRAVTKRGSIGAVSIKPWVAKKVVKMPLILWPMFMNSISQEKKFISCLYELLPIELKVMLLKKKRKATGLWLWTVDCCLYCVRTWIGTGGHVLKYY